MRVPFLDVAAAHAELAADIEAAVTRVLHGAVSVGGPEVEAFEAEWAAFAGARHCVGTGNGLDALTLALRAVGVGPGDEVIVPSHTFIATWLSVSAVGATPVPVEPAPGHHLIDADGAEAVLTGRTRAVVPVHLYGDPVDLDPILDLARRHGLAVVEDAAQAHGARYRGRRIGAHGHAVAWSFYPGKNLGAAGDAGAVTTDDPDLARTIRRLGNYGAEEKYVHLQRGVNSRLDPVQAAVLRVKLRHLDAWNARRAAHSAAYRAALPAHVLLPESPAWADPVHHLMVISADDRDAVRDRLTSAGIDTGIHYPTPPHRQGAYADLAADAGWHLPVADDLAARVLSLPMGPQLSEQDRDRAADEVLRLTRP